MAGGVALNSVATAMAEKRIFDRIWIQPVAGDAADHSAALAAYCCYGAHRQMG